MRFYDKKAGGIEFNEFHPAWGKHCKKKDGSPRKQLTPEGLASAMNDASLFLCPSVTTVTSVVDGFGTFGAGAAWGMHETIEAVTALQSCNASDIRKAATARMSVARDHGSRMHAVMESLVNKIMIANGHSAYAVAEPPMLTAHETEEAQYMLSKITKTVDESFDATELLAVGSLGVGRVDLVTRGSIVDYKFPRKKRKIKLSEMVQVATYMQLCHKSRGFIFLKGADDTSIEVAEITDAYAERLSAIYRRALSLYCGLVGEWLHHRHVLRYDVYLGFDTNQPNCDECDAGDCALCEHN